jgi:chromosome segregation ATPase
MANDLEGRVDKLGEAVGVLGERVAQVEHEQRAMRSSIDQLTGEVRQLDKRLGDMSGQFDKRLDQMASSFDKRITDIKWVISLGMGLIILLMTLYRFLKLSG